MSIDREPSGDTAFVEFDEDSTPEAFRPVDYERYTYLELPVGDGKLFIPHVLPRNISIKTPDSID